MPLHVSISDDEQLVSMRTEGEVSLPDLQYFISEMRTRSATRYRKLLDARGGHTALTPQELALYERQAIDCAIYDRLGPYAIVVDDNGKQAHASLLTLLLANSRRPSGLFSGMTEALDWVRTQQVPAAI